MASPEHTLADLERLAVPGAPAGPHVVPEDVHDLWLSICGAHLHPTEENRSRLLAAAERASAAAELRTPGRGVSVDALLRWADRYADEQTQAMTTEVHP
jgi:hypothetical protein